MSEIIQLIGNNIGAVALIFYLETRLLKHYLNCTNYKPRESED